jgi:hypothetical protein
MEDSRKFVHPELKAENIQKETRPGAPPLHKFEIETLYMPAGAGQTQAVSRKGF